MGALCSRQARMDFKERVRDAADITKVIGEVVRLRKTGPNRYIGLCPFHQEKTPSFNVHGDRQFYYCFGCQKGGDVFRFVEEIEGLGFFDALKSLAERHGIPLPQRHSFDDETSRERDALLRMQEIALQHFQESMSAEVQRYLKARHLSDGAVCDFSLGYAPAGSVLSRIFQREGFTPAEMFGSGLIVQRDDGSPYDRFRNRVMFPIHNEQGKAIAFGGRALGDDEPKYLNSSETKLYTKKRVLFNLHRAKETIRRLDYTILVEGYMDVIGLFQAGVTNVVASCGTALSEDHVRALRRHSERIAMNFDPDSAGVQAAERSVQMLLEESMKIRILTLEGGLDPDEYVAQNGVESYRARVEAADGYFHWLAARAREKFDMKSAEGRMEGFREMLRPALERVPDKLERLAVVNDLAQFLGVDARAILEQMKMDGKRPKASGAPALPVITANESLLIRGMLEHPPAAAEIAGQLRDLESWKALPCAKIVETAMGLAAEGALIYETLDARLSEGDRRLLAAAVFADKTPEGVVEGQLQACVASIRHADSQRRMKETRDQVRTLEREGRHEEAMALMSSLETRGDKTQTPRTEQRNECLG